MIFGELDEPLERRLALTHSVYRAKTLSDVDRDLLRKVEVVVMRSGVRLDASFFGSATGLELVVRAGSGTDNIDLTAASVHGVRVVTVPLAAHSVAELAIGLLLAVARQVPALHSATANGEWRKAAARGVELADKTAAVVGFGSIGQRVCALLRALGLHVIVVARSPEREGIPRQQGFDVQALHDALRRADALVLCCPLNDSTRGMIGERELASLRPGAILVNVGRGEVIAPGAIAAALQAGRLLGVGLDSHSPEPPALEDWMSGDRAVLTPHIGAQTTEARARIVDRVCDLVEAQSKQRSIRRADLASLNP